MAEKCLKQVEPAAASLDEICPETFFILEHEIKLVASQLNKRDHLLTIEKIETGIEALKVHNIIRQHGWKKGS